MQYCHDNTGHVGISTSPMTFSSRPLVIYDSMYSPTRLTCRQRELAVQLYGSKSRRAQLFAKPWPRQDGGRSCGPLALCYAITLANNHEPIAYPLRLCQNPGPNEDESLYMRQYLERVIRDLRVRELPPKDEGAVQHRLEALVDRQNELFERRHQNARVEAKHLRQAKQHTDQLNIEEKRMKAQRDQRWARRRRDDE